MGSVLLKGKQRAVSNRQSGRASLSRASIAGELSPCLPRGAGVLSVTKGRSMSKPVDLVQGTLDLLVLKMVALKPMNGWMISQRLSELSSEVLQVSDGS